MKNHHHNGSVKNSANSREVIHETIAYRAYQLWEQSGRPDNQSDAFWLQAEQELVTGRKKGDREPLPVSF